MQLKNKVAIITGSARGMGKEFAFRFMQEGARVAICDILDCAPVATEIKAAGGDVLALKTDVTREEDTAEMAKKTFEHFGQIDILVNNAAIYGAIERKDFVKPFDQISIRDWDELMAVNLKGIFLCCKSVSPYMKKQRKGKIINISSTAALVGIPSFLHYTASKGGVIAMTRALSRALGDFNINVNAIAPGLTWTEASQSMFSKEEADNRFNSQILRRQTTAKHIAGAAVFLASDDADIITGQTLAVNGGQYLL